MQQIYRTLPAILPLLYHIAPSLSFPTEESRFADYKIHNRANVAAHTETIQFSTPIATSAPDPEDFSGIKQIVSIGDSYAAGIGAGDRTDWSCSRYDHSYPELLVQDSRLATASSQFLACSGATSVDILAKQVPVMKSSIDTLLLSAGGNDVGLTDLLNDCIFGWKVAGYSTASCEKTITNTQSLIDNTLPGALDNLLTAAKAKLTAGTGRIYYTAYAQFFNQDDPQCNGVYWNYWKFDPFAQALDTARRTRLNALAVDVNKAIQAAATRAGSQVVFVDYDSYYTDFTGRFCEAGVTEPAPERDELLFFERQTTNPGLPWKGKRDIAVAINDTAADDPSNIVANGTFEGQIAAMLQQTLIENPSWVTGVQDGVFQELTVDAPPSDGSAPHILSVASAGNGTVATARHRRGIADTIAWLLSDTVKRVFHPQPNGHAVIATLVLYHMEVENAKIQDGYQVGSALPAGFASDWTEIATSLSCPLQAPDLSEASLNTTGIPTGCSQSCWAAYQTCYENSLDITLSNCLKGACSTTGPNDCTGCTVCNLPV